MQVLSTAKNVILWDVTWDLNEAKDEADCAEVGSEFQRFMI